MARYEHGRILSVDEVKSGSELVADHAAGVSSLTVVDAADFDEDGGWLSVNDQVIEYTAADDDTGTLTLNGTLTALADEGDRVYLWNPKREAISSELIAEVAVDGEGDNVDPVEATVALHLVPDLPEGIRGSDGESVLLELDGDEWRVIDVLGVAGASVNGVTKFYQDATTIPGGDTAYSVQLTYEPIENSEHVYWNGIYQPASQWARRYQTVIVDDPDGYGRDGDELVVEYAYQLGIPAPIPSPVIVVGGDADRGSTTADLQVSGVQVGDLAIKAGLSDVDHPPTTGASWTLLAEDLAVGPDVWGPETEDPETPPPFTATRVWYKYVTADDLTGADLLDTGIGAVSVLSGALIVLRNATVGQFTSMQGRFKSDIDIPLFLATPTPQAMKPGAVACHLSLVQVQQAWVPETWYHDPQLTQLDKNQSNYYGAAVAYEVLPNPGPAPARGFTIDDFRSYVEWTIIAEPSDGDA